MEAERADRRAHERQEWAGKEMVHVQELTASRTSLGETAGSPVRGADSDGAQARLRGVTGPESCATPEPEADSQSRVCLTSQRQE